MHESDRGHRGVADGGSDFRVDREPEESTTEAVLRGLAAVQGVPESEIDPLYEQVEIDALETLVRHANRRGRAIRVRFCADGYTVCVHEDRRIRIVDQSHRLAIGDGE